jgi:hypothetical protein
LDLYAEYLVEAYAAPVGITGEFPRAVTLFATCTPSEMETVIDYEYLSWAHDEEVIKEVSVAAENVLETYCFLSPIQWRLTAPPIPV